VKMEDSGDSDVSPYILRVMTNSKMLDVLLQLAGSIQVSIDECIWASMCQNEDYSIG